LEQLLELPSLKLPSYGASLELLVQLLPSSYDALELPS
jgi:hypothetical protein